MNLLKQKEIILWNPKPPKQSRCIHVSWFDRLLCEWAFGSGQDRGSVWYKYKKQTEKGKAKMRIFPKREKKGNNKQHSVVPAPQLV